MWFILIIEIVKLVYYISINDEKEGRGAIFSAKLAERERGRKEEKLGGEERRREGELR